MIFRTTDNDFRTEAVFKDRLRCARHGLAFDSCPLGAARLAPTRRLRSFALLPRY
jgi:hypothetical protein